MTHNYCWLHYLKNTSMVTTAGTTYSHWCRPFSHGTFLVLVMSCLLYAAHWFVYSSIEFRVKDTHKIALDCAHYALWVLLPVIGWVAESWLGRYQAIVVELIMDALLALFFIASSCPYDIGVTWTSFNADNFCCPNNWHHALVVVACILSCCHSHSIKMIGASVEDHRHQLQLRGWWCVIKQELRFLKKSTECRDG